MDFDGYSLKPEIYDEWFHADGTPRESTHTLYESFCKLPPGRLTGIQERVARSFTHESISFTNYHDDEITEQIIPIDCIPRVLSAHEWNELEVGLKQRITALNLFLDDIYNAAKIVADDVIPRELIRECPQYRVEMQGMSVPNGTWVGICGTDVVRTNEGFHVLEGTTCAFHQAFLTCSQIAKPSSRQVQYSPRISIMWSSRNRTLRHITETNITGISSQCPIGSCYSGSYARRV